jgi:hypothetical protein
MSYEVDIRQEQLGGSALGFETSRNNVAKNLIETIIWENSLSYWLFIIIAFDGPQIHIPCAGLSPKAGKTS